MKYTTLGRTGMRISRVSLGCWRFGVETDEATATKLIHHALDKGINLIDTANIYAGGVSEEIVGRAIKGRRHEVVLATKVWGKMGDGPNDRGLSRYHIMRASRTVSGVCRPITSTCTRFTPSIRILH